MFYGKINSFCVFYYFYGSFLGCFGEVIVGLFGGCDLGFCFIDLYFKVFEVMGVIVSYEGDNMKLFVKDIGFYGVSIYMDMVSVGVMINMMIAVVKVNGCIIIENAV